MLRALITHGGNSKLPLKGCENWKVALGVGSWQQRGSIVTLSHQMGSGAGAGRGCSLLLIYCKEQTQLQVGAQAPDCGELC